MWVMKTQESLYVQILEWAFYKHEGFTEQELLDTFKLKDEEWRLQWYLRVFRNGNPHNPSLIENYRTYNKIGYWCLSEKGMSAAVDYIELKETQRNSRNAMYTAIGSLTIATIVGLAQIVVQVCDISF